VIPAEAGGGLLTILGLGGPIGPGIVASDLVVVMIVAHIPKGSWNAQGGWEFIAPLAAGAFAIALLGKAAGRSTARSGSRTPTNSRSCGSRSSPRERCCRP
jgi:uncharacterized membrane protein YphA (DoxX/SURF4 family)